MASVSPAFTAVLNPEVMSITELVGSKEQPVKVVVTELYKIEHTVMPEMVTEEG